MVNLCPVCESKLNDFGEGPDGRDSNRYSCPRCGDFVLSRSLVATLPSLLADDSDASAKLSHALRTMQQVNEGAELSTKTVDELLKRPLPSPSEQADLLVRWLAENVEGPGETVPVEPATHSGIVGAKSPRGFALVLRYLYDEGFLTGHLLETQGSPGRGDVTLSIAGWRYSDSLRRGGVSYRRAFMALKYGDAVLDRVVEGVFRSCVRQTGFELVRLDDEPRAGLIDDRLRVEIQAADFVIADLTHDNLGAYWEAGYAEGLGKPVIYTCEKSKFESDKTHFDTNHHLTIVWDAQAPEAAGEALKATIRATLPEAARQEDPRQR